MSRRQQRYRFLLELTPAPISTVVVADAACATAQQDSGHADAKDELPQDDDAVVPILFGTEFGFCREIADKLAAELKATDGYWYATILL